MEVAWNPLRAKQTRAASRIWRRRGGEVRLGDSWHAANIKRALTLDTGAYLANAAVIGLLALAVSGTVAGLGALLGVAGIGLGVLLIFVLGNPLSAVAAAPELLPQPWGQLGQLLPPGAGATLLRATAYFDGAGATAAAWTLTAWAAAGLILLLTGRRRFATH